MDKMREAFEDWWFKMCEKYEWGSGGARRIAEEAWNAALAQQGEPEPVGWLVTGGRLFKDRAFISEAGAEQSKEQRNDGAIVQPLYTRPQPATIPEGKTAQDAPDFDWFREKVAWANGYNSCRIDIGVLAAAPEQPEGESHE